MMVFIIKRSQKLNNIGLQPTLSGHSKKQLFRLILYHYHTSVQKQHLI